MWRKNYTFQYWLDTVVCHPMSNFTVQWYRLSLLCPTSIIFYNRERGRSSKQYLIYHEENFIQNTDSTSTDCAILCACQHDKTIRPEWKLLGFFKEGACGDTLSEIPYVWCWFVFFIIFCSSFRNRRAIWIKYVWESFRSKTNISNFLFLLMNQING